MVLKPYYSDYPFTSTLWLRQSLYSSQSPWWYSDITSQSPWWWYSEYPYTHYCLITVSQSGGTQTIYDHHSLWSSDYSNTHHSLLGGTQTIYSSKSTLWFISLSLSITGGTQRISVRFTVCLVVLTSQSVLIGTHTIDYSLLSLYSDIIVSRSGGTPTNITYPLYSPQSLWWYSQTSKSSILITSHSLLNLYGHSLSRNIPISLPGCSDNPYTHHSLPGGTQTINMLITVSLVVLRLSLYSSVSLVILILFLYSSQPPWWYLGYPYTHRSLFGGPQSIPNHVTFCFVVLRVFLYRVTSQSTYWLRQSLYSSQST